MRRSHSALLSLSIIGTAIRCHTYLQRYLDIGRLFQRSPTLEVSKSETSTHVVFPRIILRHVRPTCTSSITRTVMRHLGFGCRPLHILFKSLDRCFGAIWTVGLYTSVLWPIIFSSGFVSCICYWILRPWFLKITFTNSTFTSTPSPFYPAIIIQKLN